MNSVDQKSKDSGELDTAAVQLTSSLTLADRFAAVMCRISNSFRMSYRARPGLYALGSPDKDSPVLVTANYKLSLNILRSSMKDRNAWILVVDTNGINVWCAAGKGTFCTKEILKQINLSNLSSRITHRQLILPQLGASGVNAARLYKESGFTSKFGPVRASDITDYLDSGYSATPGMRRVRFNFTDRAKLVPMEAIPALKIVALFSLVIAVLFGISPEGIMFRQAITGATPLVLAGLTGVFTGSILTPLFLPMVPFRAFTIKGFISGSLGAIALVSFGDVYRNNPFLLLLCLIAVPLFSSYLSFLFTGSTTFTSPSGVKKELRTAWPLYLTGAGISTILLVSVLIKFRGLL